MFKLSLDTDHIHYDIMGQVLKPFGHVVNPEMYKERISGELISSQYNFDLIRSGRHNPVLFREFCPPEWTDQQVSSL